MDSTREELAAYAHDAWSRWMQHLFSKSSQDEQGQVTLPPEEVSRWRRQMATPYVDLSKSEQDSDRAEAIRILSIVSRTCRPEGTE